MKDTKTKLRAALKNFFGFDKFKGLQESIIENIYEDKNTFVIMPTGAGKSLCYQLPAIIKDGTAIVVSPLIALMKNQVDAIRSYSEEKGIAEFLNSSLTKGEIRRVRENVSTGITKMLYVAPESLAKEENIEFLKTVKISFVAVDEAHCISEWGHDFRPEYRRIKEMTAEIGNVPIIALTATATPKVQSDILKNLQMSEASIFQSSFNRPNLYYEIRPKIETEKSIIKFIKDNQGKSGIVYCLSRKKSEKLAELFQANGLKALPYHAGLDAATRSKHQDMFLMEDVDVIVATIAFGMGIDKPDVRFVIHYDIPKSIESYYQETGRSGRDGLEGTCIAYYSFKDIEKLQKFMKDKPVSEKEIGSLLLNEVVNYAESGICRRRQILNYFGEDYDESKCTNMCDACRFPQEKIDAKEEFKHLLNVINTLGNGQFNVDHILKVIIGLENDMIVRYKHHTHEFFGSNHDQDMRFWNTLIKYALIYKYLEKEIEKYGLLSLTQKGHDFLNNPYSKQIVLDHDYSKAQADHDIASNKTEAADPVLFDMLKDLRKNVAKSKNLPPYIIFQDPSLEEMATQYPINQEELTRIIGVGSGKARKFGNPFLEMIKQYVDRNEIERPTDMIVKSTLNKSGMKVSIITSIDRKISLEDIASSKSLNLEELLDEIYGIVNSGTKINIDYQINQIIDDYTQEDVYEYFKETESDDLGLAYKEFDGDVNYEELQMMRIKFASEQGH